MKLISILVASIALVASCKQEGEGKKSSSGSPGQDNLSQPFNNDNTAQSTCVAHDELNLVLQQNCVSCHKPALEGGTASDLSTYATASVKAQAMYDQVQQGLMPPGNPASDEIKQQFRLFAQSGAKQTSTECASGTPTATTDTGTNEPVVADDGEAFGSQADIDYATELWRAMARLNMVGPGHVGGIPVDGKEPHGAVVEVTSNNVTVDSHTGRLYAKFNYGGAGVTVGAVEADREQWLKAVTVIYQRESGYDDENKNLFWVKYTPTGGLHQNDADTPLAGRIGKGADTGCISCHNNAQGGDFVYFND